MCSDLDNVLSVSGDWDFYGVLMGWEQLAVMLPIRSVEYLQSPELRRVNGATTLSQCLKLTSAYNATLWLLKVSTLKLWGNIHLLWFPENGGLRIWGSVNSLCHILKCFLLFICLLLFWNDWKYAKNMYLLFSGKYQMKACHILKWPNKVLSVLSLFNIIPRAYIANALAWYRESMGITQSF